MKQRYVIGIDISKSKLDCATIDFKLNLKSEKQISNQQNAITTYLKEMVKSLSITPSEMLICCENTGIYNRPLEVVCGKLGVTLWVEHAIKIKRASTDMRGKDDKKDALRIAQYAVRYIDRMIVYEEPSDVVKQINALSKTRSTLLSQKVAIENQLKESKSHDNFEYKILETSYKKILKTLQNSIKEIEQKIDLLIKQDDKINQNKELITSIPGIGNQVAINLIIATNNFEFFEDAKHLACYAGVVPFKNESGTIIKKARVSKMANKNIKSLIHLAAMAAIRSDKELKDYFLRKVAEGKNKMSVLNAIRNKLIHRIMAVIKRKEPYLNNEDYFYQKRNNLACILT
jgi:transposase